MKWRRKTKRVQIIIYHNGWNECHDNGDNNNAGRYEASFGKHFLDLLEGTHEEARAVGGYIEIISRQVWNVFLLSTHLAIDTRLPIV